MYRYYDWGIAQCKQVVQRDCPHNLGCYVQSENRHDVFNSVGHYDVLWYSLPVVKWHMNALYERAGLSDEDREKLSFDALNTQNKFLTFYLLMSDDMQGSLQSQLSLHDQMHAKWSVSLTVNNKSYKPCVIKRAAIPTELVCLFDKRVHPSYRFSYKILFQRYDG